MFQVVVSLTSSIMTPWARVIHMHTTNLYIYVHLHWFILFMSIYHVGIIFTKTPNFVIYIET
jgi:hypothetical protein